MADKPRGLNTGVIVGIATAVLVAGGGGIAAVNMMQGAPTPGATSSVDPAASGDEPAVGIQSEPVPVPQLPAAPFNPLQPGTPTISADGSITFIDESLTFSATFPSAPVDDPVMKSLRGEAQASLDKFKGQARADFDDRKKQGATELSWDVEVKWAYTAKAAGLVSLVGTAEEFTGGAHGMSMTDTLIARADTGEKVAPASMMAGGQWPSPAITIAICEALKAVKLKNINSATIYDEPIVCAGTKSNLKLESAKIALAPSTEAEKFGGLFVYYDPYVVGSYAEGGYMLTIPQEVFREDLRPAFKSMFGGSVPPAYH